MRVNIGFRPHVQQWEVMNDPHRFRTIMAGRRWGKSRMSAAIVTYFAITIPGSHYWIVAPTNDDCERIHWAELKRLIPGELISKKEEVTHLIELFNGSSILLRSADKPDRLIGSGIHGVVCDEIQSWRDGVAIFMEKIRPALSDYRGFGIFIGTPRGKSGALYELLMRDKAFNDPNYRDVSGNEIKSNPEFKSFQFKSIDNPFITIEEIEDARRAMTPEQFAQEMEAVPQNYSGVIFKEYNPEKHNGEIMPENLKGADIYVGIDTGRNNAILFMAYKDNHFYIFDEIFIQDAVVRDIARLINDRISERGINLSRVMFYIDSASQVKEEYRREGIWVIDAKKNVLGQIDTVRSEFKKGNITIGDCPELKRELVAWEWDYRRKVNGEIQPQVGGDHVIDCALYVIGNIGLHNIPTTQRREIEGQGKRPSRGTREEFMRILNQHGALSSELENFEDDMRLDGGYNFDALSSVESNDFGVIGY